MKRLSIQKLSLLGVVLMAASAVTAAILPADKSDANNVAANGSLTASDNNSPNNLSCTPTDGNYATPCNNTASALGGASNSTVRGAGASASSNTTLNDAQ